MKLCYLIFVLGALYFVPLQKTFTINPSVQGKEQSTKHKDQSTKYEVQRSPFSNQLRTDFGVEYFGKILDLRSNATLRQASKKCSTVRFSSQARIQHSQYTTVRGASYQSTKPLLQSNDCLRYAVFVKTGAAGVFDVALARGHDRIRRYGERQLVDDHT